MHHCANYQYLPALRGSGPPPITAHPGITMEAAGSSGATPKDIDYGSITDFVNMVELYRGRHSVVWRCTCKRSRQPLVVKGYVKEKMRERHYGQVAREVVLMQKCRPAGIVRFAGSFEDDRVIYIVQEDCSKGDLFQLMNACGGRMAEKDVVRKVITPLLQSLEVLHEINVLHRDIKPENIFFATDGTMRLGDFGLAICTNSERPKSRVGTLDYMVLPPPPPPPPPVSLHAAPHSTAATHRPACSPRHPPNPPSSYPPRQPPTPDRLPLPTRAHPNLSTSSESSYISVPHPLRFSCVFRVLWG